VHAGRVQALLVVVAAVASAALAAAAIAAPTHPTIAADRGHLTFNGLPFMPVIASAGSGCPERDVVDKYANLGVDVLLGGICPGTFGAGLPTASQRLEDALSGRSPTVWFWAPATSQPEQQVGDVPEVLDWQASVTWAVDPKWIACVSHSTLPMYAAVMKRAASGSPVVAQILVGSIPTTDPYSGGTCVTPVRINAEVYTSLLAGASAFDWVTINPRNANTGGGFNVAPAAAAEAATLSQEIGRYAPIVLSGTPVAVAASPALVKVLARRYGSATYLFAVNTQERPEAATITFSSARNTTAHALKGGNSRAIRRGVIQDSYAPLAVHIFKINSGS
jgi:hypothetical protein